MLVYHLCLTMSKNRIKYILIAGAMPGPILYATCIDYACLLWEKTCDGTGSCLYFDNFTMGLYVFMLTLSMKLLSALFTFLGWVFYRHRKNTIQEMDDCQNKKDDKHVDDLKDGNVTIDQDVTVL